MRRIEIDKSPVLEATTLQDRILHGLESIHLDERKVLLVCEDNTRPTPINLFFPKLLENLLKKAQSVTVLLASGTHRPMTHQEIQSKLGIRLEEEDISVVNHNAFDASSLVSIGKIDGKEARIHRLVAEHDVLIGIGCTTPHRVAGFSGGAKLLCPGIANEEMIAYTHWKSSQLPEQEVVGKIRNPVREIMDAVPEMIEGKLGMRCVSINCVIVGNEVADVFIDSFDNAYSRAAEVSRSIFVKEVQRCKSILAKVSPRSVDFWQAAKAVYNCARVIQPGGMIIVSGDMPDGISSVHKDIERFGYSNVAQIEKLVEGEIISDPLVASHMIRVSEHLERVKIFLSSPNISPELCRSVNLGYLNPEELVSMNFDYVVEDAVDVLLTAGSS